MAEGDRAPVHVHALRVGASRLGPWTTTEQEGLVQLHALHVADRLPGLVERLRPGLRGRAREVGNSVRDGRLGDDRGERLEPVRLRVFVARDDGAPAPSLTPGAFPAVVVPSGSNTGSTSASSRSPGRRQRTELRATHDVQIGSLHVNSLPFVASDAESFDIGGRRIAGVIGKEVLTARSCFGSTAIVATAWLATPKHATIPEGARSVDYMEARVATGPRREGTKDCGIRSRHDRRSRAESSTSTSAAWKARWRPPRQPANEVSVGGVDRLRYLVRAVP